MGEEAQHSCLHDISLLHWVPPWSEKVRYIRWSLWLSCLHIHLILCWLLDPLINTFSAKTAKLGVSNQCVFIHMRIESGCNDVKWWPVWLFGLPTWWEEWENHWWPWWIHPKSAFWCQSLTNLFSESSSVEWLIGGRLIWEDLPHQGSKHKYIPCLSFRDWSVGIELDERRGRKSIGWVWT